MKTNSLTPILVSFFLLIASLEVVSGERKDNLKRINRYSPVIYQYAKKHRVDADLVHAIIRVESGFNPRAISHKGAIGLMQLMPETALDYGIKNKADLYKPGLNLDVGTRHFKKLLDKYESVNLALAAYNAGESALGSFRKKPIYPETKMYVTRVIDYYWKYKYEWPAISSEPERVHSTPLLFQ